jgi:hypothetical protein
MRFLLLLLLVPIALTAFIAPPVQNSSFKPTNTAPIARAMTDTPQPQAVQAQPTAPKPVQESPMRSMNWLESWSVVGRRKRTSVHPALLKKPRRQKLKGMGGKV